MWRKGWCRDSLVTNSKWALKPVTVGLLRKERNSTVMAWLLDISMGGSFSPQYVSSASALPLMVMYTVTASDPVHLPDKRHVKAVEWSDPALADTGKETDSASTQYFVLTRFENKVKYIDSNKTTTTKQNKGHAYTLT